MVVINYIKGVEAQMDVLIFNGDYKKSVCVKGLYC